MIRLTSGKLRGRLVQTPKHHHTRPTQARLRQALFNSIQSIVPEARVLDLFAGSGALGFEALSRGAREVVFVEKHRHTADLIRKNAEELGVSAEAQVLNVDVDAYVGKFKDAPFDLVLADPPYAEGWESKLLELPWNELLVENGILCLEWGALKSQSAELPERTPFLVKIREKNYGDSVLTTYERQPSS